MVEQPQGGSVLGGIAAHLLDSQPRRAALEQQLSKRRCCNGCGEERRTCSTVFTHEQILAQQPSTEMRHCGAPARRPRPTSTCWNNSTAQRSGTAAHLLDALDPRQVEVLVQAEPRRRAGLDAKVLPERRRRPQVRAVFGREPEASVREGRLEARRRRAGDDDDGVCGIGGEQVDGEEQLLVDPANERSCWGGRPGKGGWWPAS